MKENLLSYKPNQIEDNEVKYVYEDDKIVLFILRNSEKSKNGLKVE